MQRRTVLRVVRGGKTFDAGKEVSDLASMTRPVQTDLMRQQTRNLKMHGTRCLLMRLDRLFYGAQDLSLEPCVCHGLEEITLHRWIALTQSSYHSFYELHIGHGGDRNHRYDAIVGVASQSAVHSVTRMDT